MCELTISLPDTLSVTLENRANAAGFRSKEDYLVALVQADCERVELDAILKERFNGPFAPLETNWKQQVREAARQRA